jgi:hypothetical protein
MGLATRFFFIDENHNIIKVPTSKFCRFWDGDPDARFPQYKNQRLRCADITVELENRKPVRIVREHYGYIVFDRDGGFDRRNADEELQLAMTELSEFTASFFIELPKRIINRKTEFADRILENKFRWTPSQSLQNAIYRLVLG